MIDKEKDTYIRIRLDADTKERFKNICQKRAINLSELIRQWITKYVKENS